MVRILGRANSINVQKVTWCAAELGLDVERVDIGLQFGGNDTPEYLAKNPNGLIPTLEDGDLTVWESNTIVRYLVEQYGKGDWALATPAARALASQWMDWYLTAMHPPMTVIFRNLVRTPEPERDMDGVRNANQGAAKLWRLLDAHLATHDFVCGAKLSVGDIPVGCSAYRWFNMDVERPELPHLAAWYERLRARNAYTTHVMLPLT